MVTKIPSPVIGVLGEVFSAYYTHAEIDRLFAYADASGDSPPGNKIQKTVDWLRTTNTNHADPLRVLGILIEEIMEKELFEPSAPWEKDEEPEWSKTLSLHRKRTSAVLTRCNLHYVTGGIITTSSGVVVQSLEETVAKGGLSSVAIEIERALKQVFQDPNAAAHYAANVLEASLKVYITRRGIKYNEEFATLRDLWPLVRADLGINAKDFDSKDIQRIASGLNSIVDGTMHLRNKKSAAHGRSEALEKEVKLRPRHARLAVHTANTLAVYILECLEPSQA